MVLLLVLGLVQAVVYAVRVDDAGLGASCEDVYQPSEFLAAVELNGLVFRFDLGERVNK